MPHDCRKLFVYGTLMRHSAHAMAQRLASRSAFLGAARCPGRLYNLGRYPGLVVSDGAGDWVYGELLDLGDQAATLLGELDKYENADETAGALYERRQADVIDEYGQTLTAWTYWYRGGVNAEHWIKSGRYHA